MKKKLLLIFLAFLLLTIFCAPLFSQHTIRIKHTYYNVLFDTVFYQGILNDYWQTTEHYKMVQSGQPTKVDRRTCASFKQDTLISKRFQLASQKDYDSYNDDNPSHKINVGHIIPFEAMAFNPTAAKETMLFNTNTAFQDGYENQHQWAATEKYVLDLAATQDSIHVFTGVLVSFSHPKKYGKIFIPDYYFKVAVEHGKTEAWLAVNASSNTSTKPSDILIDVAKLKSIILQYYPNIKLPF